MKKNGVIFVTMMLVLAFVFVSHSFAQRGMRWKGSGGWGAEARYSRMYDPKTVETLAGEVVSVDRITPSRGMSYGCLLYTSDAADDLLCVDRGGRGTIKQKKKTHTH